ncbi:MAG: formylglycine-generating enzyme family protein, partial [Ferruginibacter sp.]
MKYLNQVKGWSVLGVMVFFACNGNTKHDKVAELKDSAHSCMAIPPRFGSGDSSTSAIIASGDTSVAGMVLIKGGTFDMGGDNNQASPDEYPKHKVKLDAFYIDENEVTNAQFKKFVDATGYITTSERKPDWEELKQSVPPGTPKPADSLLVAASLVFKPGKGPVDLANYAQWWSWVKGADWKHPEGPASNLNGKENYPVVQVSWDDAMAYCKWAGKRLPTEAEWEYASRGGLDRKPFIWGDDKVPNNQWQGNIWQGQFPNENQLADGFKITSPVASYPTNGFGLFDMGGN